MTLEEACAGAELERQRIDAGRKGRERAGECPDCWFYEGGVNLCPKCGRAKWEASDLGRLFLRHYANPEMELVTYARAASDGQLTTISWRLQPRLDCNGDPSGWWVSTVRTGDRSRFNGSRLCADPFYSTTELICDLDRETT